MDIRCPKYLLRNFDLWFRIGKWRSHSHMGLFFLIEMRNFYLDEMSSFGGDHHTFYSFIKRGVWVDAWNRGKLKLHLHSSAQNSYNLSWTYTLANHVHHPTHPLPSLSLSLFPPSFPPKKNHNKCANWLLFFTLSFRPHLINE